MRIAIAVIICLVSNLSSAAGREACQLLDTWNTSLASQGSNPLPLHGVPGKHFDAHSHWPNGLLSWEEFVELYALDCLPHNTAKGTKKCKQENMQRFLVKSLGAQSASEGNRASPRLAPVSNALLSNRCLSRRVGQTENGELVRVGDLDYATTLEAVLSATPQTAFDSAYFLRGKVKGAIAAARAKNNATDRNRDESQVSAAEDHLNLSVTRDDEIDAYLKSLAEQEITYSEQFTGLNTLKNKAVSQARNRFEAAGVVFFAQFTNHLLAASSNKAYSAAEEHNGRYRCVRQTKNFSSDLKTIKQLPYLMADNPMLRGIDVLAPEKNCTLAHDRGRENLHKLISAVYDGAKKANRRMVVHIHAGEGYPIFPEREKERVFESATAQCDLAFEPLRPMLNNNGVPLHYEHARDNVTLLLDGLEKYLLSAPKDFHDNVKIRLGHVTHVSAEQAKKMAALNIQVDVNLTSNLVTGALTVALERRDHLPQKNRSRGMQAAKSCTSDKYRDALERSIRSHALMPLLENNVDVMLGTDGPGVEHSQFSFEYNWVSLMAAEYHRRHIGPKPADFDDQQREKGAYVDQQTFVRQQFDKIEQASRKHACWMGFCDRL